MNRRAVRTAMKWSIAGAAGGTLAIWFVTSRARVVEATARERACPLPGDDLIPTALGSLTHAIDVQAAPRDVWPWLVQMGAGTRAGWYSYDRIDNAGRPSADRVIPELQHVETGMVFPAMPGVTEGFVVAAFEPGRCLVLGWKAPDGSWLVTWAFVLEERRGSTRLIVRARGAPGYSFRGLPWSISRLIVPAMHFIMQRKQLLGIVRRAERHAKTRRA
jgi:hypothetical protein